METKYYLGPMSLNIVDCVNKINNENEKCIIGLIPSRRQVEYSGGYVNNWTTQQFSHYVKQSCKYTTLQRDHGGRLQGNSIDDGKESYLQDIKNGFNIIHIDPWKSAENIKDGCIKSIDDINYCLSLNKNIKFEIGTEEAIYPYDENDLEFILNYLKQNLNHNYHSIEYAVVQGGTKLKDSINIGDYNLSKLKNMCDIANNYGLKSKEHNGDYLTKQQIDAKFEKGLSAINIAPEFGVEETKILLSLMNKQQVEQFYNICFESKKWTKWVSNNFDLTNKEELIKVCGHYNFTSEFVIKFVTPDMNSYIQNILKNKILEKIQ
jgi:hypothetical protein